MPAAIMPPNADDVRTMDLEIDSAGVGIVMATVGSGIGSVVVSVVGCGVDLRPAATLPNACTAFYLCENRLLLVTAKCVWLKIKEFVLLRVLLIIRRAVWDAITWI